ncbi:MAG: 2Fe-2S iron-sulfur cluster-binding protein [Thermaerobacter sp.]|nr:2Fe-2S iron-sulfur cluster-binding protein [Thermaerobacter sp.]
MPMVTIDGRQIEVEPGTSIIQAADRLGVEIPRFCYHPDLRPEGNCRMCLVEVDGFARLAVACATPVADGMVVRSPHTSPQASQAVNGVLEFLLVNHPLDCPICDQAGECSLQDFYMHPDYGLHKSHVDPAEKVHKRKRIDLGPRIVLDAERCVMCSRCVRFSADVSGKAELQFIQRGNHVELMAFEDRALEDPYAGNLADVCPVGALTSRDFRFKRRVWHLEHTNSVCAGCSTGCNVRIDHFQNHIERVVPRRNPSVNSSWICDEGRLSWQAAQGGERLTQPASGGGYPPEIRWSEAVKAAHELLTDRGERPLAVLGSASATNETLLLLRRYAEQAHSEHWLDFRLAEEVQLVGEREDQLLRRRDKHPNTLGAVYLGLAGARGGLPAMLEAAQTGEIGALLLVYYPPLVGEESAGVAEGIARLLANVPRSVVLTTHRLPYLQGAALQLPVAAWSEEEGTYTNFAGTVQVVERAIIPPGMSRPATAVLADLVEHQVYRRPDADAERLFAELARTVPAYQGMDYAMLDSRTATTYPPEGRMHYGQEGFAGR